MRTLPSPGNIEMEANTQKSSLVPPCQKRWQIEQIKNQLHY